MGEVDLDGHLEGREFCEMESGQGKGEKGIASTAACLLGVLGHITVSISVMGCVTILEAFFFLD